MNDSLVLLAAIFGPVFSSISWVTEQEAIKHLSPLPTAAISSLSAGLILLGYAKLRSKVPELKTILEFKAEILTVTFLRGILATLFFAFALVITSSAKVMFLTKMEPYILILIHWVRFREKVAREHLVLLAIHIAGAIILSTGGQLHFDFDQIGDLLIFVGLVLNALSYAPAQVAAKELGSTFTSALTQIIAGALLLPAAYYFRPQVFSLHGPHTAGWIYLAITVVNFYILSTSLWFYSLQGLKPWLNSALRCLGPVIAAPLAWYFFEKQLTAVQLVGAFIVIITSLLMIKARAKT